ncbi:magnesium-dependent phosphatase 1-like isoform X2 [Homalodisca vitripennis]|nr:magnesium-dependent phosphatase 1-like isoform X2 [Homalodisca vitripennis]
MEPPHRDHNMVVFVLDRTIWPFQVDKLNKSLANLSEIKGSDLGNLTLYPETHACLDALQKMGYVLAAVCNCKVPRLAENLLDTFDLTRYFAYQVCSEWDKVSHLETLHAQSGVDFEDMLYFDYDLRENIPLFDLNITFCPVDDRGISMAVVTKALEIFSVRTTLKPPLSTTAKLKNSNDSSEYSLVIDYKNLDFKKELVNTEEIFRESSSEEDENE